MTREEITGKVASWIQEARDAGKTHVLLKLCAPELQMHAYPKDPVLGDPSTITFRHKKIEIPDGNIGNRVTEDMLCEDQHSPRQLAAALLDELFAVDEDTL